MAGTPVRIEFGGTTYSGGSGGTATDIWACTLAVSRTLGTGITSAMVDAVDTAVYNWFVNINSKISSTEALEFLKVNEFDPVTGHQISDPTIERTWTGVRAPFTPHNPVTTCYRVSMDDGTRNRRHRGGFFPPRCGLAVQDDGRWSVEDCGQMLTSVHTMLSAINAIDDWSVAIWSRMSHTLQPVSRIRISDVPDDQSRRKNKLRPTYTLGTL